MKLRFEQGLNRTQPDPFMCQVEDGWAMYVTGINGVEAYVSDSPFGIWRYKGIVCAIDNCNEYWAPCIIHVDDYYYLYFSCINGENFEFLHVARSKEPFGPFEDVHCMYDHFSIDAHVVQTEEGLFLWYAQDDKETERPGTMVYVERLLDPYTPDGNPKKKVMPTYDEEIFKRDRYRVGEHWHTIEGPFWLEHEGYQYVMYSGACFENDTYHIGYAVAKTTEQDLTKVVYEKHTNHGKFEPLMTKNEYEEGVGHHSVIYYEGDYYAVYHGRDIVDESENESNLSERRTARICKLCFKNGEITAER